MASSLGIFRPFSRDLLIVPFQKLSEHSLFHLLPLHGGLRKRRKRTKVTRLTLEGDLRYPLLIGFAPVYATNATGVALGYRFTSRSDRFYVCAVYKMEQVSNVVLAPAAGGMPALKVVLLNNDLLAALAATAPHMKAFTLTFVAYHSKVSKLLPDIILNSRST